MESLFDKCERTNFNFSDYLTPTFKFFNETAKDEFSRIRDILENWYLDFPRLNEAEFLGRFRSDDNQHLLGALLELFTHRLFRTIGYKTERTADSCDFIASMENKEVLLECTLSGNPLSNDMVEQHVNLICDRLNYLKSKFFINLSVEKFNNESPAQGKLARWVESKIKEIDTEGVYDQLTNGNPIIEWTFDRNGWIINVSIIPKSRASEDSRNMGIIDSGNWGFIDSSKYIFDAIHDKRPSKYGGVSKPYVIVVNSLDPTLDKDFIIQALFKYRDSEYGYFGNRSNQKNKTVSGVLILKGLYVTSIHNPRIEYWQNPWAKYPIELPFDTQTLTGEQPYFQFRLTKGLTPDEVNEKMIYSR
jgi:hypothetical protein